LDATLLAKSWRKKERMGGVADTRGRLVSGIYRDSLVLAPNGGTEIYLMVVNCPSLHVHNARSRTKYIEIL